MHFLVATLLWGVGISHVYSSINQKKLYITNLLSLPPILEDGSAVVLEPAEAADTDF